MNNVEKISLAPQGGVYTVKVTHKDVPRDNTLLGYTLFLDDGGTLPSAGVTTVVVAEVGGILHVRVFDPSGAILADVSKTTVPERVLEFDALRALAEAAQWDVGNVDANEIEPFIAYASVIAGLTQPQKVSIVVAGGRSMRIPFRILALAETAPGSYTLTWASNVGSAYRVQRSTDLSIWSDLSPVTDILATAEITSHIIAAAPAGNAEFFRVRRLD